METPSDIRELPDIPAEERVVQELIQGILKLRWMGMEDEAGQMQLALRQFTGRALLAGRWSRAGAFKMECLPRLYPLLSDDGRML